MPIERIRDFASRGLVGLMLIGGAAHAGDPGAPASPQQPVTDTYHGVTVSDPYRWLENTDSEPVRAWSAAS